MRNATKRKSKVVLSALAAAGMSAWAGSTARAAGSQATFTIGVVNMGVQTLGNNQWQDWVITATRTDGTGTGIDAIDVVIDTGGTANLGIDIEKVSGNTINTKYDANVDGGTFDSAGIAVAQNQSSPAAPYFGDVTGGTFIGIGTSSPNAANPSAAGFTPDLTNNPYVTQAGATGSNSTGDGVVVSGKGLVFVNGNVGTSTVDVYGPVGGAFLPPHLTGAQGNTLSAQFTNIGSVNVGSTGNALLNGAVTKLEVIVTESDPGQQANGIAVPFANVVVPVGTVFTVSGAIAPNSPDSSATFGTVVGAQSITPPSLSISLTASPTNGANIGTVTIVGTNGSYTPGTASPTGPLQTTGNLLIKNAPGGDFTSNTHTEVIGLDAVGATSLAALEVALAAALQTTNAGATVGNAVNPILVANGDNVEIDFPGLSVPNTNPESLSYDLSNYTGNGTVTITQITVVPEPTSIGALALGGLGLLSRRRRKARA
jgi:hypothetical protein